MEEDAVMDYFVKARVNQAIKILKVVDMDVLVPKDLKMKVEKRMESESLAVPLADYVLVQSNIRLDSEGKSEYSLISLDGSKALTCLTSCIRKVSKRGRGPTRQLSAVVPDELPLDSPGALYDLFVQVICDMKLDMALIGFFTIKKNMATVEEYMNEAKKYGYLLTPYPNMSFHDINHGVPLQVSTNGKGAKEIANYVNLRDVVNPLVQVSAFSRAGLQGFSSLGRSTQTLKGCSPEIKNNANDADAKCAKLKAGR